MKAERIVAGVQRVVGVVCTLGVAGLFLPRESMARVHEWCGLGTFPDAPITVYLARSTSALCALYGGLLILTARDVKRYRAVVAYQAWGILVVSTGVAVMCWGSGRLSWFILVDAAICWVYAVPVLILLRRIDGGN